ncbi:MAG: DUF3375 domain-containing protein [Endozoicomonas sp.]|uniref:DUF3375 domain-containing protein n=1 Tax=Endozoicomonas sp. TaxID=1892382 RepID=UPI003D9ADB69
MSNTEQLCKNLIIARHQSPAWLLLASRRAPLILSCLKPLFDGRAEDLSFEEAQHHLAEAFSLFANNDEFDLGKNLESHEFQALARRELREWINKKLIVERDAKLLATDDLQQALNFIDLLDDRVMTSTASRLATVQREIESLENRLSSDPKKRADYLKQKIQSLQEELKQVESGHFKVLEGPQAIEGVREVYNLSMSLRADFRRVEDSYRAADKLLRQSIITEQNNRGEIVDKLLDGHDDLLKTIEGQVFHGFYEQLNQSVELDNMKHRLRTILTHPATPQALNRQQQNDLRWLIMQLVIESKSVIRARARSEKDVKGFLKTGLAAEHHRVGQLLNQIMETSLNIDWQSQNVRRSPGTLPPINIAISGLPLLERLLFKSIENDLETPLQLTSQTMKLDDIDDDFWQSFDSLDRHALIQQTLELLENQKRPLSISELSEQLPPTHDLETLALWLSMAREAGLPITSARESVDISSRDGEKLRFDIPDVKLRAEALNAIDWEL